MPDVGAGRSPREVKVQRSDERFLTRGDGTATRHSFSYGVHYEPTNIGFGQLIAINEETVEPGQGYEHHHHADVEIVTWVLEGSLLHEDTAGHRGVITPGVAQRLSTGDGVQHSERNASKSKPLRFIQMMLRSDNTGEPSYEQVEVPSGTGELVPTVSVLQHRARLLLARLDAGQMIHVPASACSYVHIAVGTVSAAEHLLRAGDALRLAGAGAYDLSATAASGGEPAEVLIWQMQR
ncbi:MAG: pirin family protein [Aeromicrobium sp.]